MIEDHMIDASAYSRMVMKHFMKHFGRGCIGKVDNVRFYSVPTGNRNKDIVEMGMNKMRDQMLTWLKGGPAPTAPIVRSVILRKETPGSKKAIRKLKQARRSSYAAFLKELSDMVTNAQVDDLRLRARIILARTSGRL